MISELTAALVVLFGGILTLNGTLTLGNFVQFLIYLGLISQALLQLGTIYQRYQQTRGGLVRLTPLLQPTAIHDAPDAKPLTAPRGEISFDRVSVQMEGQWLLRDISLNISAGKAVAFVGRLAAVRPCWSACWRVSSIQPRAASWSMASTFGRSGWPICDVGLPTCHNPHFCSVCRSIATSTWTGPESPTTFWIALSIPRA